MSAYCAPQAESAPAVRGSSTRRQPSSRAIGTMLSPAAPPPATSVTSRGSMPCVIVISRIAPTMCSRGDRQRRVRCLLDVMPERRRHAALDRRARGVGVERQPPPRK